MAEEEKQFIRKPSEALREVLNEQGKEYADKFENGTGFAGLPLMSVRCYVCATSMRDTEFINIARHITRCEAARDGLQLPPRKNVIEKPKTKQTNYICCLCSRRKKDPKKSRKVTPFIKPATTLMPFPTPMQASSSPAAVVFHIKKPHVNSR